MAEGRTGRWRSCPQPAGGGVTLLLLLMAAITPLERQTRLALGQWQREGAAITGGKKGRDEHTRHTTQTRERSAVHLLAAARLPCTPARGKPCQLPVAAAAFQSGTRGKVNVAPAAVQPLLSQGFQALVLTAGGT